ncbi:hypothetical protein M2272_003178 [Mycobacterium frederiksbergense]|uniref:Uncharacterized protein n=1 Tax=Mycolicibacterium frederiksbergense TaxID=117567 RepID=A0ABT6L3E6_9MYCO|nr:hypothetical protein [Mycolicibacterium frederiksbergense]MDH6196535.1 hypothetical protein [Mycolicibacterium frederiksbergense]
MKMPVKFVAPWLAAAAITGAVALAPIASAAPGPASPGPVAGTDPLVPYGTDPAVPYRLGYIDSNHDEANTTSGGVDLPF